jgi:photosystem II stability/assembly factor-like uncharacterized protein
VRFLAAITLICSLSAADWTLYTCMAVTKDYVVGAKLPPSGLFRRVGPREWQHIAYNHPFEFAVDADPHDPGAVYVAAGNGLLRVPRGGDSWKILTAQDVTELRDLSIDSKGAIYFAHSAGIRMSTDHGASWREISGNLPRKYTEAIRADRSRVGVLLSGGEDGVWRTENAGASWRRAGASGLQVMRIQQSPHDPCVWFAGTQQGGLFASRDCGVTFENRGSVGVGRNIYDIAFDPGAPNRIALAIWGDGVVVSEDGGKTWQTRGRSLPNPDIWSLAFDPTKPGRLFASVHEEAVYVSDDAGFSWARDGLEGSIVNRMKFIQEQAH